MFKSNPRLLNCWREISLVNRQSKLARTVNNHIRNVRGLDLGKRHSGDVDEHRSYSKVENTVTAGSRRWYDALFMMYSLLRSSRGINIL